MSAFLAAVASGHVDAADICLLIAVILFTIATIVAVMRDAVSALVPAGLAFTALAFLVL